MECLRLRVKDIDLEYNQITIRDAKGNKDRVVPLAQTVKKLLQEHLKKVKQLYEKDLKNGHSCYLQHDGARSKKTC